MCFCNLWYLTDDIYSCQVQYSWCSALSQCFHNDDVASLAHIFISVLPLLTPRPPEQGVVHLSSPCTPSWGQAEHLLTCVTRCGGRPRLCTHNELPEGEGITCSWFIAHLCHLSSNTQGYVEQSQVFLVRVVASLPIRCDILSTLCWLKMDQRHCRCATFLSLLKELMIGWSIVPSAGSIVSFLHRE